MAATRTLAAFLSNLQFEDLPPAVVENGKLAIIDVLGNAIGGYPLPSARAFLDLALDMGGGRPQATLIGDGDRLSVPWAAFANGALSTMLDYSDSLSNESGNNLGWLGALAVPAALAAGEPRHISGKALIVSVVAGYEAGARVVRSMDRTTENASLVTGATTSVFAAAGAAARALELDEDQFLSALGMTGIYTPVPAGYKWLGDAGLTPRKDIKQGWAWMCMTGAFAAVSAQKGLQMLQQNNVLDGERGLWRTLGMDTFQEENITAGLGDSYHILDFNSKTWPGCATTHTSLVAATGLLHRHGLAADDIAQIDVGLSETDAIGFDDRSPTRLPDMQFSLPFQVAAALVAGDRGPNWYLGSGPVHLRIADLAQRVNLSFDEESDQAFRRDHTRLSKVTVVTRSGDTFTARAEDAGRIQSASEVAAKFLTTTSQVLPHDHAQRILHAIQNLENLDTPSDLVSLLHW